MHSSRMRTTHSSSHQGGLHQAPPQTRPPREQTPPLGSRNPPCGQTHTYKHITLPQTSFAGGNYCLQHKISITSNNCIQSGLLKSDPGHLKLPSRGPVGPFTFKSQRHPCEALMIIYVEQVDSPVSAHVVCKRLSVMQRQARL